MLKTISIENSKRKTKKVWNKVFKSDCFGKPKEATYNYLETDKCVQCEYVHECGKELIGNMLEKIRAEYTRYTSPSSEIIEDLENLVKRLRREEEREFGRSFTTK